MNINGKKPNLVLVMIIYLAGIFMGALDTGIVTPARTIIQNNLGVDATAGVWMITIYTLAYAVSIPVMGKLADRYGRKTIYLLSISLFGLGSLFCGLSQTAESFSLLLIARAVQAIGGGGILPVATAEFGTSFPPEKRGLALGLVGGVFGMANVFGASAGSAILDIFGQNNWQLIFYINIPISLFIIIAGLFTLKNNKAENTSKIDALGITTLTVMILALLYGLKNIDFFNLNSTIGNTNVYPFLILFVMLIPVFILIERKAQDPVINLEYFTNKNILLTLAISFLTGFIMAAIIFAPQFSENALRIKAGSGGYLVIIIGIFSGISAPISGKLIDKFGVKIILALGFASTIISSIFLIFITAAVPSFFTVFVGLVFVGIGIGFIMGPPLNYMMLANTDEKESNSALAILSLIRSIGMSIAPAVMISFIAHAGASVQTNIDAILPTEINVPPIAYAQEITEEFDKIKANPNLKDKIGNITFPDLTSKSTIKIKKDDGSNSEMPEELLDLMKSSDVTCITENSKIIATAMFDKMTQSVIGEIQQGISAGISGLDNSISQMTDTKSQMQEGIKGLDKGIDGMQNALQSQKNALVQLKKTAEMLKTMAPAGGPQGMDNAPSGVKPINSIADMIPENAKRNLPETVVKELESIKSAEEFNAKILELETTISSLEKEVFESTLKRDNMQTATTEINSTIDELKDLKNKMIISEDSVPAVFETAKNSYLEAIDEKSDNLEITFQSTMNVGFNNVFRISAISSVIALLLLAFYSSRKTKV